jgi:hypothetical protein
MLWGKSLSVSYHGQLYGPLVSICKQGLLFLPQKHKEHRGEKLRFCWSIKPVRRKDGNLCGLFQVFVCGYLL